MKKIETLAIIGTGLLGGSLGLAVKKRGLACHVIGVSRKIESITQAKRSGAIDTGSTDLSVIRNADMIVICLPVKEIIRQAPHIVNLAKNNCLICDVGSTKTEIVKTFASLTHKFVGCHPMAGSERRGIDNASAQLFNNSFCILTQTRYTDLKALTAVRAFWKAICAKTIVMTPKAHDRAMALVSHLPHIVAFALVNSVPKELLQFTASGFRDSTRIASSDENIWSDIFSTNRNALTKSFTIYERNFLAFRNAVAHNKVKNLRRIIVTAKHKRLSL